MGPYIMLPFAGPSTLRDTASSSVELYEGIDIEPTAKSEQNTIKVVKVLNGRAGLLDATNTLDSIALDKYSFLRDVYLKRREATTQPMWTPEPADDGWGDGTANGDSWDDTPADNTVR
jgi:phospholipid-binding lipoprotein MlaA